MLLRGIPQKNALCHRGGWTKSAAGSFEMRGKMLGIVGYGHIGTQVGVLAESLGMQVIFHDIETKLSLGNARAVASLDELLERADVVTLHVPETPATQMMIGATQLAQMRAGAMLINASRGTVVDIDALAAALRERPSGRRRGRRLPARTERQRRCVRLAADRHGQRASSPRTSAAARWKRRTTSASRSPSKLVRYSDNGSHPVGGQLPRSLPARAPRTAAACCTSTATCRACCRAINELFSRRQHQHRRAVPADRREVGYVVIDVTADAAQATC